MTDVSSLVGPTAALIDASSGSALRGRALRAAVERSLVRQARWPSGCAFLAMRPQVPDVLTYLALVEGRRPVALLPPEPDAAPALVRLVARYRPAAVVGALPPAPPEGYHVETCDETAAWVRDSPGAPVNEALGLLLPTSGSTGSPKLVRISTSSLLHNTGAITEALGITSSDVAVTSLPLHYSFGMSVLNTHLAASATVVLTDDPITARAFWEAVDAHGVTTFAGVPQHFVMLRQLRIDLSQHSTLRDVVQAGGRLDPVLCSALDDSMRSRGGRVHVMYGQTEAAPRMSVLPADRLADKPGSAGAPLRDGRFSILLEDGSETVSPDVPGEVVYRGPNVMLGYAESAEDLALGDVTHGVLRTGDLGHVDAEGYLFVSGRASRLGKVFGKRVNLDDVEGLARAALPDDVACAATSLQDRVFLHVAGAATTQGGAVDVRGVGAALARAVGVHASGVVVQTVDQLPRLPSGKIDYRSLREDAR